MKEDALLMVPCRDLPNDGDREAALEECGNLIGKCRTDPVRKAAVIMTAMYLLQPHHGEVVSRVLRAMADRKRVKVSG